MWGWELEGDYEPPHCGKPNAINGKITRTGCYKQSRNDRFMIGFSSRMILGLEVARSNVVFRGSPLRTSVWRTIRYKIASHHLSSFYIILTTHKLGIIGVYPSFADRPKYDNIKVASYIPVQLLHPHYILIASFSFWCCTMYIKM